MHVENFGSCDFVHVDAHFGIFGQKKGCSEAKSFMHIYHAIYCLTKALKGILLKRAPWVNQASALNRVCGNIHSVAKQCMDGHSWAYYYAILESRSPCSGKKKKFHPPLSFFGNAWFIKIWENVGLLVWRPINRCRTSPLMPVKIFCYLSVTVVLPYHRKMPSYIPCGIMNWYMNPLVRYSFC